MSGRGWWRWQLQGECRHKKGGGDPKPPPTPAGSLSSRLAGCQLGFDGLELGVQLGFVLIE